MTESRFFRMPSVDARMDPTTSAVSRNGLCPVVWIGQFKVLCLERVFGIFLNIVDVYIPNPSPKPLSLKQTLHLVVDSM